MIDEEPRARERARAAKAHKRAMPIARLVANGMDFADAFELHGLVDAGLDWPDAAERLAGRNLARARRASAQGHLRSAHSWFLLASACFRFGQVSLPDTDPRKRALYRRMLNAFGDGGQLIEPPFERVELPWRDGQLSGWLIRAANASPHPLVISLCGIGGSREEYEVGTRYLIERGISALLVDAPGQGETRLFGGLYLDENVIGAVRAFVDFAVGHPCCNGRVGIWGNSAGGWLAALTAAADARVAACCVTGGTDRPTEILDRYPRFIREMQQMTGHGDPAEARAVLDGLAIDAAGLRGLRCPCTLCTELPTMCSGWRALAGSTPGRRAATTH
jgi:hypothetical protein